MRLNGLKILIVSHHLAKCSGHGLCSSSSNTGAKIFYVALKEHVVKGSGDFIEGNSSMYISTLLKLIAIDIVLMDT